MSRHLFFASDHAGFSLKEDLLNRCKLESKQHQVWPWLTHDLGPKSSERVDYPDFADLVVREIANSSAGSPGSRIGVLICGSGQGMAIRANRHPLIRAALCWTPEVAQLARSHYDANVLCLGGRLIDPELAWLCLKSFLDTKFEGGRHSLRVDKLATAFKFK